VTGSRIVALASVAVVTAVGATGCKGANDYLPGGSYSGSTAAHQSVIVDVSDRITLNGVEMRPTPSKWFVGAHDKKLRMRCHTADNQTEIVCTIDRRGQVETDELMKL
jgi:hypothetical protein